MKFVVTAELTLKGMSKNREFDVSFEHTAFFASEGKFKLDPGLLSKKKGAYRYVLKYKNLYLKTYDDYTVWNLLVTGDHALQLMSFNDFSYPPEIGDSGDGFITIYGAAAMPHGRITWKVKTAPTVLSEQEKEHLGGGDLR